MSKKNLKKMLELGLEFDTYVVRHPEILKKIPNNASIIITTTGDADFNAESRDMVRSKSLDRFVEARKEGRGWKVELKSA